MHRARHREQRAVLRGMAEQLRGLPVDDARVLVESAGGTLHRIDELELGRRSPTRVNVRVQDGVIASVLSIG